MSRVFRLYQTKLVQAIYGAWSTVPNVIAVCATGSGKTVMAARLLYDEPGASVFIAHRTELVSQASVALAREGVRHRIIGPEGLRRTCVALHMDEFGRSFYEPQARCAVAGVDTLVRMDPQDGWFKQVALWICDEAAHLLVENKWGRAVAMFPNARGVGFTATPTRSDGKGLGRHADGVFDVMVQGPPMRTLIESGFLTPYRLFCPPNDIDLTAVPVTDSGDYSPERLRKAVHKSKVVGDIVLHYLRVAPGKLGMTFCVDVEAAEETAVAFRAAGVEAQVITGKTPDLLRASIMRRFRNREILQLVSVDIMGEGVDVPAVEVVQLARPTMSYGLHCQQIGRGLRLMDGKTHALILDHAGNSLRHGLVDAPREWSLDRRERRSRTAPTDVIPVRTCLNPECMSVYERIHSCCPYCGHAPVVSDRSAPDRVDGDLHEVDPAVLRALRGEIARIDGPAPLIPGLGGDANAAIFRRHNERQAAQRTLRQAVALWAGWQRAQGREDPESYRRFFFKFGTDVATAETLGANQVSDLEARIRTELSNHNVRELT